MDAKTIIALVNAGYNKDEIAQLVNQPTTQQETPANNPAQQETPVNNPAQQETPVNNPVQQETPVYGVELLKAIKNLTNVIQTTNLVNSADAVQKEPNVNDILEGILGVNSK